MKFKRPTPRQVELGLRALKTVALAKGSELSKPELEMLAGVQRFFGTNHDVAALDTVTPSELSGAIRDDQIRTQITYALIALSMIDGVVDQKEAKAVEEFAGALGVDERSVGNLRHLADHHLLILRFDVLRRFWAIDKLRERIKSEGPLEFLRFAAANVGKYENAELAARFDTLRKLPPGTLGAEYINYMDRNGFPLPGHKGAISDIIAYHDMTHVLSGYGTDPAGEVQVASFSAGYRRREPFTFVLFVLLQFHVGVRMTPGAAAERGYFDAEKALVALERGAAMNIDLSEGWDYWEVIDHPVQDLRIRYNIPPYSE